MIGYRYYQANDFFWRSLPYGLCPLSPPCFARKSSLSNLYTLLFRSNSLYLRWESNFSECSSRKWWHVTKDNTSSLELCEFSSNTRSKIRRASKYFTCRKATLSEILSLGYYVYKLASSRYGTPSSSALLTKTEFFDAILKLHPSTEFWAVFANDSGKMVAFSENFIQNKTAFYDTIWFTPSSLKKYFRICFFMK